MLARINVVDMLPSLFGNMSLRNMTASFLHAVWYRLFWRVFYHPTVYCSLGIGVVSILMKGNQNSAAKLGHGNEALKLWRRLGRYICTGKCKWSAICFTHEKREKFHSWVIQLQVISRSKPTTAKKENWVWIPKRSKAEVLVKKANVASLVVRNGWQGIIYVILDVIGKSETTLGELLRSALEHRKYNLALTMLKTLNKAVHTGEYSFRWFIHINECSMFGWSVESL